MTGTNDVTPPPTPPSAASDVCRLIEARYLFGERIGVGGSRRTNGRWTPGSTEALAATVLRLPNIVACPEVGSDAGSPS